MTNARPAVFLDRDGVIIEETHYLSDPDRVALIPGASEGIARLNAAGIPVVVVTNQAGVARGYFSELNVGLVHQRLDELLRAGRAHIDRYYYCPHHPEGNVLQYRISCTCRKPGDGMLRRAAAELGIDLQRSYLVGDRETDLLAGLAAKCEPILVETGYGRDTAATLTNAPLASVKILPSLGEAIDYCFERIGSAPLP